jgi:hypothetical protein
MVLGNLVRTLELTSEIDTLRTELRGIRLAGQMAEHLESERRAGVEMALAGKCRAGCSPSGLPYWQRSSVPAAAFKPAPRAATTTTFSS